MMRKGITTLNFNIYPFLTVKNWLKYSKETVGK